MSRNVNGARAFGKWVAVIAALGAWVANPNAQAQSGAEPWPPRTVKLVVPFTPGAGVDVIARLAGEKLAARWGNSVVVENKPGGNTIPGAQQVVSGPKDGSQLLVTISLTMRLPFLMALSMKKRLRGGRYF